MFCVPDCLCVYAFLWRASVRAVCPFVRLPVCPYVCVSDRPCIWMFELFIRAHRPVGLHDIHVAMLTLYPPEAMPPVFYVNPCAVDVCRCAVRRCSRAPCIGDEYLRQRGSTVLRSLSLRRTYLQVDLHRREAQCLRRPMHHRRLGMFETVFRGNALEAEEGPTIWGTSQ